MTEKMIRDAYCKIRTIDQTIPDDVLDFMKDAAIEKMNGVNKNFVLADVSSSLPSLDDATKVAVRISEEAIKPLLDAKEQALFIAGFQECIKWLNVVFSNDR